MKRALLTLAIGLGAFASMPAQAVTYTLSAPNLGPQAPAGFVGGGTSITFDNLTAPGFTGGAIRTGSLAGSSVAPVGDATPYYSVGPSTSSPATLTASGFNQFSLYWGSLDDYNTISFTGLGSAGVFTGSQVAGNSDGINSYNVTFNFTAAEAALITGVQFASTGNAFEFDNVAFGMAAVPEPASWAMMMFGIGMVGGTLRSRRTSTVRFGTAAA